MKNSVSSKNKNKSSDNKSNTYYLIAYILLFGLFLTICLLFASKITERKILNPINYHQKGNIEYKVYLHENDFYSEEYLGMNRAYVASLIKNIDINFNYLFNIEENTNMTFDYKIVGELIIENSNGVARYLEKEYVLSESKKKELVDNSTLNIKDDITIDYGYYNQIVNSFKSTYGVDINGYLNVYLEVSGITEEKLNYKINETNKMSLRIPLSERAIEISLNTSDLNLSKQVFPLGEIIFNIKPLLGEVIFFIPTCILLCKIIKYLIILVKPKTKYDKFVNKLLKEYDRLIVEIQTPVTLSKYNVIEVKNFNELLDVRDNLKIPILYLNIKEHLEGMFYIINDKNIYMLMVKNNDLKK